MILIMSAVLGFLVNITSPVGGEVWARGQNKNAIIEWISGNNSLPDGFPASLDIWFTDLNLKMVSRVTNSDPSINARWVFDSNNVVPVDLKDGQYYVLLVNSRDEKDFAYSNSVNISGGVALKPEKSEKSGIKKTTTSMPKKNNIASDPNISSYLSFCLFSMMLVSLLNFV